MLGVKVLDAEDVAEHKKKRKEDKDKVRQGKKGGKHGQAGHKEGSTDEREAVDVFNRFFAEPEAVNRDKQGSAADKDVSNKVEPLQKPAGNHVDPAVVRKDGFTVGDGGASWRMKALKRAQVQAEEQGSSLRDVVSQRWGSVAELAAGVEKAAPMNAHRQFSRGMKSKMKRPGASHDRDRHRHSERGDAGERRESVRDGGRRPSGGDGFKRQRDTVDYSDVVKRAARDINEFADDGSFMDRFKEAREPGNGSERADDRTKQVAPSCKAEGSLTKAATEEQRASPAPIFTQKPPSNHSHASGQPDNNSVAAMLRARLSGKTQPVAQYERDNKEDEATGAVHLPMVDSRGRAAPGAFGRETTAQAHTRPCEEADLDLQTMVRRVKHGTEEGMNDIIARNIAKNAHYRQTEADDEYDFDVGTDILTSQKISKRGKRDPNAELARKDKARQVDEYRRMTKAQNQCRLCLDKNSTNAHLTVSMSSSAYLALPDRGRLVPGHCCVIPNDHIASCRLADETTWEEMRNFKKCVLQMMESKGMDCIFFETALDVTSTVSRHHARIDCVPVSHQVMAKAPMYFKKEIEDATSDWAQHASKGCIETESRHLQRKIPPNFPYVHIEFGLSSGFVSVIDEPREFDRNFCRRVILGLLESSGTGNERNASAMQAKGSREGSEAQKAWTREFKSEYASFDWVQ